MRNVCKNYIFLEITKLNMNDFWMILYKIYIIAADGRKSKMAPTVEHYWTEIPIIFIWICLQIPFLWNYWNNWSQTWKEGSINGLLSCLCFPCQWKSKMATMTGYTIILKIELNANIILEKLIENKWLMNDHWMIMYNLCAFDKD